MEYKSSQSAVPLKNKLRTVLCPKATWWNTLAHKSLVKIVYQEASCACSKGAKASAKKNHHRIFAFSTPTWDPFKFNFYIPPEEDKQLQGLAEQC